MVDATLVPRFPGPSPAFVTYCTQNRERVCTVSSRARWCLVLDNQIIAYAQLPLWVQPCWRWVALLTVTVCTPTHPPTHTHTNIPTYIHIHTYMYTHPHPHPHIHTHTHTSCCNCGSLALARGVVKFILICISTVLRSWLMCGVTDTRWDGVDTTASICEGRKHQLPMSYFTETVR